MVMTAYTTLLADALSLPERLSKGNTAGGCVYFFKMLLPLTQDVLTMARIISTVALSLRQENNAYLIACLQDKLEGRLITLDEVNEIKTQILIGIYLVKWYQYNTFMVSYINKSLIELFQHDLKILNLGEIDIALGKRCLDVLAFYCSLAFQNANMNKKEPIDKESVAKRPADKEPGDIDKEGTTSLPTYAELIKLLGPKIQVDITEVRHALFTNHSLEKTNGFM